MFYASESEHFCMQTTWANAHPLGQIAHPLQAFCPNVLIHYFRYATTVKDSLVTYSAKLFHHHRHKPS